MTNPRQGRVLAVGEDRLPEHLGVFERAPHELGVGDRHPVVRERDRAGLGHLAQLRQLLPLEPLRDGAHGEDVRRAGFAGLRVHVDHADRVVAHAARVGHHGDAREAAGDRRRGARGDRLLVLAPRLAEVDVHVDEAGDDDQPLRVDGLVGLFRDLAGLPDLSAVDEDVERLGVLDQDHPFTCERRRSTAARTATPLVT
jgi:hypothetical protein